MGWNGCFLDYGGSYTEFCGYFMGLKCSVFGQVVNGMLVFNLEEIVDLLYSPFLYSIVSILTTDSVKWNNF